MAINPAAQIAADMRALPEETRKALRPVLRAAGEVVAADARGRASWSTRIPSTVKVSTSFQLNREGVTIRAGGPRAPHAGPFENRGKEGTFRHPVYGRRTQWVAQAARPFLGPAARSSEAAGIAAVSGVLDAAAAALGFSG